MTIHELATPLPVEVTSTDLPRGVRPNSRKGTCIAWWCDEETHSWLVCFDQTGELVWVPMSEIKMRANWSNGRRYTAPSRTETLHRRQPGTSKNAA